MGIRLDFETLTLLQVGHQKPARRIAPLRILRENFIQHLLQRRLKLRLELGCRLRRFVDNFVHHCGEVSARKRLRAGEHFVQHDTEREDIGTAVDGESLHHFRRYVGWRPQDLTWGSHVKVCQLGDTEIHHLCPTLR